MKNFSMENFRVKKINIGMAAGFFIAACAVLFPGRALAAKTVSLEECLAIAEASHPNLTAADGQIMSQRGRLGQLEAGDRPEVSGSVSTSRSGSGGDQGARYSAGVNAGVKIFDANRSKYSIESQRGSLAASEEGKRTTLSAVRANVKTAYMALLLNMEITGHRLESVRGFEAYLEQAKAFYETGLQPWYNVTKAEVDLGKAQLALAEAVSDVEIAKVSLFNAMGVDMPDEEYEFAPIDFAVPELFLGKDFTAENEILSEALANRSDYRAAELELAAGQASLKAEARSLSPSVSLSGGFSRGGEDLSDLESGWDVGLSMSIPIIDGGAAKAGMESARGQLMSLEASREKLRQDILLEVRKALAEISKARERIRISEMNAASAEENRKIAMGRYETGAGDPFEVTDALLSYTEARLENRQAMYDMQMALAALEQSIGN